MPNIYHTDEYIEQILKIQQGEVNKLEFLNWNIDGYIYIENIYKRLYITNIIIDDVTPDWKNNSEQTHSYLRDQRLSTSWGTN